MRIKNTIKNWTLDEGTQDWSESEFEKGGEVSQSEGMTEKSNGGERE